MKQLLICHSLATQTPTTFRVDPSGKPAETYYRVLQKSPKYSLIELKPKTGRTHQLRVHLKHLHPILGDPVYGSAQSSKASKPKKSIQTKPKTKPPRLFLRHLSRNHYPKEPPDFFRTPATRISGHPQYRHRRQIN